MKVHMLVAKAKREGKLAVASGVKRQTVANWERGLGGPQSKHIVLMSRLAPFKKNGDAALQQLRDWRLDPTPPK